MRRGIPLTCIIKENVAKEMLRLKAHLTNEVVSVGDYREPIQKALVKISELFCAKVILVFEYDNVEKRFFLVSVCSNGRLLKNAPSRFKSLCNNIKFLKRKKSVLQNNKDKLPPELKAFESVIVTPMILNKKLNGVSVVAKVGEKFNKGHKLILDEFWDEVSLLIEHIRSLERLESEKQRYSTLVENVPETVYSILPNKKRTLIYMSDDIFEFTGYAPQAFIKNPKLKWKCIDKSDRKRVNRLFEDAIKNKKPFAIRYKLKNRQGFVHYVRDKAEPVFEGKRLVQFDGVIQDETEHMKLLEELKRSNERLSNLLEERSQLNKKLITANEKLENQKDALEEVNEQLESLDKLKDEFISIVSHEMKTPLFAVNGYVRELLDQESDNMNENQRTLTKIIKRNARRLESLVLDVLLISKLEAGRLRLDHQKTNVKKLTEDICSDFDKIAKEKGLKIECRIENITAEIDANRIAQVMTNFVSNAIKYTDKGKVSIRLLKNKDSFRFEVEDTGPGISANEIGHLFEKFYRVEKTRRKEGTGLGLAISKALVEAHGGTVGVDSKPNKGSVFHFIIPLKFRGKGTISGKDLLAERPIKLKRKTLVGYA